jgi:hypothetical protein
LKSRINGILLLIIFCAYSCTKDKTCLPPIPPEPEVWEKFIGDYDVYDTNGIFLYQMEIENIYHDQNNDSLVILNFNQNFDLRFHFQETTDEKFLNIRFHDSVVGYDNYTWQIYSDYSNNNDLTIENRLIDDTIIMKFEQTNIQHWVNEGVPYYYCDCKQVAVKQ